VGTRVVLDATPLLGPRTGVGRYVEHLVRELAGLDSLDLVATAFTLRGAGALPAAVPAGVYARDYLRATGVWAQLESKVVPVANVRAALSVVENGSADAAIVYETDVALSKSVTTAFLVTGPHAPRIAYPAAIVSRSRQADAARRFLAFLRGAKATEMFRQFGFTPMVATP